MLSPCTIVQQSPTPLFVFIPPPPFVAPHRYQCLRCLRYDLCQHCFFYGHTSRGHRLEHPMQEYCYRSATNVECNLQCTQTVKDEPRDQTKLFL